MQEVEGGRAIVLAIHPRHAARIYAGEKTAELRRSTPSARVRMAFIYETAPVSALTGVMLVDEVHRASPSRTWREFSQRLCISEQEFFEYIRGCRAATVYEVSQPVRFPNDVSLVKATRMRRPPQSYTYLDRTMTSRVLQSVPLRHSPALSTRRGPYLRQSTLHRWEERASELDVFRRDPSG